MLIFAALVGTALVLFAGVAAAAEHGNRSDASETNAPDGSESVKLLGLDQSTITNANEVKPGPPIVPPTVEPEVPPVSPIPKQDLPSTVDSNVPPVTVPPVVVPPVVVPPVVVPPSTGPERHVRSDEFQNAPALNTPIKANPVLDSKSAMWSSWLGAPVAPFGPARALLYDFGLPVYYADSSTPLVRVIVDNEPDWGTNDLSQQLVPIPAGVAANPGSDSKLVVVDPGTGQVYDLQGASRVGGQWHASWGGVYSLDGSGSSPDPDYTRTARQGVPTPIPWPNPTSRGTGSGMSSYAGLVRLSEIQAGEIDHALVFATDHACGPSNDGPYRFPATTTDGSYMGSDCIPEGTRVQLDPSIDVNAISGITPGERAVARALQVFGAYAVDNSPDRLSFAFEAPKAGQADPYPAAGFTGDYYNMPHIPWNRLRVLRDWQGT